MSKDTYAAPGELFREGFWTGLGQFAAYGIAGLLSGLIVAALLPTNPLKCPASKDDAPCACGCK